MLAAETASQNLCLVVALICFVICCGWKLLKPYHCDLWSAILALGLALLTLSFLVIKVTTEVRP